MTSNTPRFNYIITIHNKEKLIEQVLTCILMCCRENSHIYPVLDGCTDQTEAIVDQLISTFSSVPITKIHTPDVHEIKAINAGLRAANQEGEGFNIILQDDVLLRDIAWESKIVQLYEWAGDRLGFVSFRLGADLTDDTLTSSTPEPLRNHIENAYGHGLRRANVLLLGQLAYRDLVIKSPICIPFKLIREVGLLEERLAPYMCDDFDYSLRCIKAGYQNAVFGLRFQSDIEWGGTREKIDPKMQFLMRRNMDFIREWHRDTIQDLISDSRQNAEIIEVPNVATRAEKEQSEQAWEIHQKRLDVYIEKNQKGKLVRKVKKLIKKMLFR